jgi:hypothetical protein
MSENNGVDLYQFSIAPVIKKGKPALMIRRFFCNEEELKKILDTIMTTGKVEFKAIVTFNNPFLAKARLKELGMI